jgi:DNA-binding FadR family transcriptional regulator
MLQPIEKKSLSDEVFEQLCDQIVRGERDPGSTLPGERSLSDALDVNRGAVREALNRLEQAGLVERRHGGATTVLDYREAAGSGLLGEMLFVSDGIDMEVARSVMELRSALGADAAARASERSPDVSEELLQTVDDMRQLDNQGALMDANMNYWEQIIDASNNLAYRLTFNSVLEVYGRLGPTLSSVLVEEITDRDAHERIAEAIGSSDAERAGRTARTLLKRGEACVSKIADDYLEADDE